MCRGSSVPGKRTVSRGKRGMRFGSMARSAEFVERGLQLAEGVSIAGPSRHGDSVGERFLRRLALVDPGKQLAKMEVAGDIFRMRGEQQPEMFMRARGIAGVDALQGQAVTRKRVAWIRGYEFLEHRT